MTTEVSTSLLKGTEKQVDTITGANGEENDDLH